MFPNFERPDYFIYETLTDKIFLKLLTDSNCVYENLIQDTFKLKYGKLWIDGYHGLPKDPRFNGN